MWDHTDAGLHKPSSLVFTVSTANFIFEIMLMLVCKFVCTLAIKHNSKGRRSHILVLRQSGKLCQIVYIFLEPLGLPPTFWDAFESSKVSWSLKARRQEPLEDWMSEDPSDMHRMFRRVFSWTGRCQGNCRATCWKESGSFFLAEMSIHLKGCQLE